MTRLYRVKTERFGTLLREDDNIAAARAWAKRAFGVSARDVQRHREVRRCNACDSAPCCCDRGAT